MIVSNTVTTDIKLLLIADAVDILVDICPSAVEKCHYYTENTYLKTCKIRKFE